MREEAQDIELEQKDSEQKEIDAVENPEGSDIPESEPEYDAGKSEQEIETAPVKNENMAIRRRIEREKKKAREEKDAALQQLLNEQAQLREEIRKLTELNSPKKDEGPQIDEAQTKFVKSLFKESISEFMEDGERAKQSEAERLAYEQAEIERREAEELAADCMHQLEEAPNRYPDFSDIVGKTQVEFTQVMTECLTRSKDPAAFLYNACKYHPAELRKISQIRDPFLQIQEVARLQDRIMSRITPNRHTSAPEPISDTRSSAGGSGVDLNTVAGQYARMNNGAIYRD